MGGKKGRYISHQHTSTQITQIDTQGTICAGRKRDERLHGKNIYLSTRSEEILLHTN